ncbi:SPOSA6832_00713 [Sporobolomyces salmonicolor]|uniref:SPOSA6832_00713-mRNA-1:cds n=1 Tax=Sporidiobolus salmonicolor TaxID=5005 RepID=A0A0D6EI35_SPOSA|nr:SPOSA6832_00713 [Sporobolomyces salmonicolor]
MPRASSLEAFAPAFGASTAQPAAGSSTAITKNTKFQDLPDSARNVVEEIDNFIRQQSQLADELTKKNLGSEIVQTQRLYEQYSAVRLLALPFTHPHLRSLYLPILQEATSVTSLLQTDSRLLASLRAELEQTLADLHKTTALIEGYKNPQGPKAAEAKQVAGFPYEFFRRKAEEMRERVARYKGTMEQIASLVNSPAPALSPAAIAPTLKAQHASLVSLASAVSALDLELKALKDEYRAIWREKTGRGVDPFRINGAGAGGAKGLEVGMRGVEIR